MKISINQINFLRSIGFLFLLVAFVSTKSYASDPNTKTTRENKFFKGAYAEAQQLARLEGKLLMIDFYASWCLPCKWMDQTTFNDRQVVKALNDNYIAIKIDIDEKMGFDLKNKYDVQFLPTLLIFNSAGQLLDRIEETMPPNKMLNILEQHNSEINRKVVKNSMNSKPRPAPKNTTTPEAEEFGVEAFDIQKYRTFNENRTYRIQLGVFDDHKNAFNKVNEVRDQFAEPIIVLNDYRDGQVIYKVMMGEFKDQSEANGFRDILKNQFGIDAIVQ